jgi:hypothetical protein
MNDPMLLVSLPCQRFLDEPAGSASANELVIQ